MGRRPALIVTGLSGLLGSRLTRLAGEAFSLVNIDIAEGVDIGDRAQLLEAAQRAPAALALVHLAAFTDVSRAEAQTGDANGSCWRVNVAGTQNVAEACRANGLHLIHVSTDFVFDGRKEASYAEDDLPNPIEWYGRTKWMAEEAARTAGAWTIVRIAFPYVAGPAPRPDLVRSLREKLARNQEVRLFTDQIITPTFADDIVQGILLLARMRPNGEVFHLAGSSSLSPFDLGRKIAAAFDLNEALILPSTLEEYLKTDPRPRQRCLRMSNAKWSAYAERHGLSRPLTIEQGLERVRLEG